MQQWKEFLRKKFYNSLIDDFIVLRRLTAVSVFKSFLIYTDEIPIPSDKSLASSLISWGIIGENLLGMISVVLTKFDFFKERDIDPKFGSFPWARDTKYPFEYFKINKWNYWSATEITSSINLSFM